MAFPSPELCRKLVTGYHGGVFGYLDRPCRHSFARAAHLIRRSFISCLHSSPSLKAMAAPILTWLVGHHPLVFTGPQALDVLRPLLRWGSDRASSAGREVVEAQIVHALICGCNAVGCAEEVDGFGVGPVSHPDVMQMALGWPAGIHLVEPLARLDGPSNAAPPTPLRKPRGSPLYRAAPRSPSTDVTRWAFQEVITAPL